MLRHTSAVFCKARSSKVYELRIYDIIPSKYDALYEVSMKHIGMRPLPTKCQGCWTSQMGGLNQMLHIWEYDSLQHRYDTRKVIDNDKEWQRKYSVLRDAYISSETNMLMRMIYREGTASTLSYKYMMQFSPKREIELSGPSASLAATFQVVVGEKEGQYFHIVKGLQLDDIVPISPSLGNSSKIMGPTRWSASIGCLWR